MTEHAALEDLAPSADLRPLATPTPKPRWRQAVGDARSLAPGLTLVAMCVGGAYLVARVVPSISPLVAAVAIGAILANLNLVPDWSRPAMQFSAKRLLRLGVVLLGFQLAIGEVLRLGVPGLAVVGLVVTTTFFGTQWLGRRLGVSPSLSLLVATGFSICGASAVAAVEGVSDADEEEVAFAIALVTLCGSLAIAVLPVLAGPLGLEGSQFGAWAGASVHDIAQVVATASTGGSESLRTAVIVKLTRIVLLAPVVAGVTLAHRRRSVPETARVPETVAVSSTEIRSTGTDTNTGPSATVDPTPDTRRPPIMPLFVVGFLGAIVLRSASVVPTGWLPSFKTAETLALAAALVGLGTGVRIAKLRKLGGRPLVLAMSSWLLIATVSYLGVVLVGA